MPMLDSRDEEVQPVKDIDALKHVCDEVIESTKAWQLLSVSRMEGTEELK